MGSLVDLLYGRGQLEVSWEDAPCDSQVEEYTSLRNEDARLPESSSAWKDVLAIETHSSMTSKRKVKALLLVISFA